MIVPVFVVSLVSLGAGQNRPPKVEIDYGRPVVSRTQAFYDKYQNPKQWMNKPIDWRDQSGKTEWEKVSRDFIGHRYDFEKYKGYVAKYRKSRSKNDALRLAIAYLVIGGPDDKDLNTYFEATYDGELGTIEYVMLRESLGAELSPAEARIMLLMDCAVMWNLDAWVSRYRLLKSKGMEDDRLTRTIATKVFTGYLSRGSDGKNVEEFAKLVEPMYKANPTIRSRNAYAGSRMALGKLRKDVKLFDEGRNLHKFSESVMPKSSSIYDQWYAKSAASDHGYWNDMRAKWFGR